MSFEISDNFSLFLKIISLAAIFYSQLFSKKRWRKDIRKRKSKVKIIVLIILDSSLLPAGRQVRGNDKRERE